MHDADEFSFNWLSAETAVESIGCETEAKNSIKHQKQLSTVFVEKI